MNGLLWPLLAVLALAPLAALPWLAGPRDDPRAFWAAALLAAAGTTAWAAGQHAGGWRTGVSAALWVSLGMTTLLFAALSLAVPAARRLALLLGPYLIVVAGLAVLWRNEPMRPLTGAAPGAWLAVHIALSLTAYSLLTLAAVASAAVVLRERALKAKWRGGVVRLLPSVAEGESQQLRLLVAAAAVLAGAVATGVAMNWIEWHALLRLDHKTVLSLGAFALTAALIALRRRRQVSMRRAAHYVLVAYLLVTLAYPGVKFVTDVLLG